MDCVTISDDTVTYDEQEASIERGQPRRPIRSISENIIEPLLGDDE